MPNDDGAVADGELGQAVDIEHANLDGLGGGGLTVGDVEVEVEDAPVLHLVGVAVVNGAGVGRPFKIATLGIKADASGGAGVVHEVHMAGLVVGIDGLEGEAEGLPFVDELGGQGQDAGGAVGVGNLNVEGTGEGGDPIGGTEGEGVMSKIGGRVAGLVAGLGGEVVGGPTEL